MSSCYLITGATGFIGGHLAEACIARGHSVRAIARPESDTAILRGLGATIYRGDLADPRVVREAMADAKVVVHCAAKVGDRGSVEEYRTVNVEALKNLLEVCKSQAPRRFIHVSSLGVYEPRHHHGTDETEPPWLRHTDGYTQSKAEAEQLALQYNRDQGVPVVVLRPGFVYGPRDRIVLPKLIERLRNGTMRFLGGDRLALNTIYVGNLVDAVFLAVDNPRAVGQVYNLTDGEFVSKGRFVAGVAEGLGVKVPRQVLPRWLAGILVRVLKRQIRRAGTTGKSWLTQAQFKFLLLNLDFSIEKARRELNYRPRVAFEEGLRQTMAWYRQNA